MLRVERQSRRDAKDMRVAKDRLDVLADRQHDLSEKTRHIEKGHKKLDEDTRERSWECCSVSNSF